MVKIYQLILTGTKKDIDINVVNLESEDGMRVERLSKINNGDCVWNIDKTFKIKKGVWM